MKCIYICAHTQNKAYTTQKLNYW